MPQDPEPQPPRRPALPRLPAALLRRALPGAEHDEVLADLAAEHAARRQTQGKLAAGLWLWRQTLTSLPALARRGWWRGWSGFETPAERLQPGEAMLESWAIDVRFALRRLRRRPTYTALTVLTLALGVAAIAAVYGVARQLLVDPLPARAEEEVVVFWFEGAWSEAQLAALRPEMTDFRAVAAFRHADVTLQQGDTPARLLKGYAGSAELFDVLGVAPAQGRGFQPGDDLPGAEPVVVLSQSLWRELGASPEILGETLELSGVPTTVVGVMPPGFWFPDPAVRLWLAQQVNPDNHSGNYGLIARMPPGASPEAMGPQLERLSASLTERFGPFPEEWDLARNPYLIPLRERLLGPVRPALLALLGAAAALLLIACVNVAALMLGQTESRGTELAMRRALGAGRRRLVQQLVVEALALGVLAGAAGALLALAGFRFLVAMLPLGALAEAAAPDWGLFWIAMGVAVLAAALVALVPGATVAQSDPQRTMSGGRTGGVAGRGGRLEHGLVVGQVALVLLLTSGAALLTRSVDNLRAIDPGVDVQGVAVVDVQLPATIAPAQMPQVLGELVAAVESLPGVAAAAAAQRLPLLGSSNNWGIEVEGRPELAMTTTAMRPVTPGYFQTMGIPVESGRGLQESDRFTGAEEGTVVINRALADQYFAGEDPLGRRISFSSRWDRIVGVVGNVAESELSPEPVPTRYQVFEQVPWLLPGHAVVLRANDDLEPAALLDTARQALQSAVPSVAVRELTTMESLFTRSLGPAVQVRALLAVLAATAMVLGAIGIYGVVSHFVTRRQRDWGIRIALGLHPARVAGQIISRGGALIVAGALVGLVAFLVLARLLSAFLYGVGAADPVALLAAVGLLVGTGLLAASFPAWRASRVDPAGVLRES